MHFLAFQSSIDRIRCRNSKRGGMATHAGVALELGITRPSGSGMKMMSPQMEAILIWCQCRVREYEVGAPCPYLYCSSFSFLFAFPSYLYWNGKLSRSHKRKERELHPHSADVRCSPCSSGETQLSHPPLICDKLFRRVSRSRTSPPVGRTEPPSAPSYTTSSRRPSTSSPSTRATESRTMRLHSRPESE